MPLPDRELLHLYYRVTEEHYFRRLGYPARYLNPQGLPNKRAIRSAIQDITDRYREAYDWFRPEVSQLRFGSLLAFSQSFLEMIRG